PLQTPKRDSRRQYQPVMRDLVEGNRAGVDRRHARRSQGHDGIVAEGGRHEATHFVACRPEQIKSATGNRGTFDPNNPSILYQDAVPAESEIERLRARLAKLEAELGEERRLRRTSAVTGLRNKIAFDEDEALGWPIVASFDFD